MKTLQEYLHEYPWPAQWSAKGRPLDLFWPFDLPVSVEKLWPYLIDTSSFNRRLELPEMIFSERNGTLFGFSVNAGITMEWEEVPWEWEYGRGLSNARIYNRGFAHVVRARYLVEQLEPEKVRLIVYFGWIPRSWIGRLILRIGMKQLHQRYQDVLQQIVAAIHVDKALEQLDQPVSLSEATLQKLSAIGRELILGGLDAPFVDRLLQYVRTAGEEALARIRVKALARLWQVPLRHLLSTVLHATRKGLFLLSWDVICPHCRGVRSELPHLGEVPKKGNCEVCDIDFDATGMNSLEVTFHLHPSIAKVSKRFYCSAEPAKKPHIRLQETLNAGESRSIETLLGAGRYRLRIKGRKEYSLLTIDPEVRFQKADWISDRSGEEIRTAAHPTLSLQNMSEKPETFILEENTQDLDALRPVDLFDFQEFRDLFSQEAIAADIQLDIGVQTILFTDIVGSTKFYEVRGDSGAFASVRQHFLTTYEIVRRHEGAVVKTIGDAVMAAFVEPLSALESAIELQRYFNGNNPETSLRLRITLNTGSCLAVNLNSNIDYFGSTVNLAAKLQSIAAAGQIVFTQAVLRDPAVEKFLESESRPVETIDFPLTWSSGVIPVQRIQV